MEIRWEGLLCHNHHSCSKLSPYRKVLNIHNCDSCNMLACTFYSSYTSVFVDLVKCRMFTNLGQHPVYSYIPLQSVRQVLSNVLPKSSKSCLHESVDFTVPGNLIFQNLTTWPFCHNTLTHIDSFASWNTNQPLSETQAQIIIWSTNVLKQKTNSCLPWSTTNISSEYVDWQ